MAQKDAAEAQTQQVTVADMMAMFREVLATRTPEQAMGMTSAQFDEILTNQHAKTNPHNPYPPEVSAFNPKGEKIEPRPKLDCRVNANGAVADPSQLTAFEIHSYNMVARSIPKPGDRRSTRRGRLMVERARNGDSILMTWPCKNIDDYNEFNGVSVAMMCHELVSGEQEATQDSILERLAALESENKRLKGEAVPA